MERDFRKIAHKRVLALLNLAKATAHDDSLLTEKYLEHARKVAMAAKIRLPRETRRQICRGCGRLLIPGLNSRVRLRPRREAHLVVSCLHCGRKSRIPTKERRNP